MEAFQAGRGVCGRETPSGGIVRILAFADHLHAQKPIEHFFLGSCIFISKEKSSTGFYHLVFICPPTMSSHARSALPIIPRCSSYVCLLSFSVCVHIIRKELRQQLA